MQIRETTLSFPVVRGSGPMAATATLVFPREVMQAVAGIRGYQVGFAGDDHHVGLLQVTVDTAVNQNVVTVTGQLGCRDWSGFWDDNYGGSIQVSVLADLVSITQPPPRGDLQIDDVELNQAVQYFRSVEHLDAANVRPDNSIPLVAGKTTAIRVYVDYDASAGLPAITQLSGELIVTSGGATQTIAPMAVITPRRATEINRASADNTLNFQIPGAWCDGTVNIRMRVFDGSAPGQSSGSVQRTLNFVRVNPLRIYAVGVNYTGNGLNLPAPVESDFATTLGFTRKIWPTGEVLLSGYTTIDFSGDLSGTASDGCGDGFNALLEDIRDVKGDTDDLVYGMLAQNTPLTGVGGCGGDGAGTGAFLADTTLAHEAGHAFGRKHAPCDDEARCNRPRDEDGDYPHYGSFNSDSIGEFGFDALTNQVLDPATAHDVMGYSGNRWVSPYTYSGLFTKGDPQPATPQAEWRSRKVGPGRETFEWIKARERVLFLRVRIGEGDDVEIRPSFTYEAYPRLHAEDTAYEVHVTDADGRLLSCRPLKPASALCCSGCGTPSNLIGEIPAPDNAARLSIRRDGEELASSAFEEPVRLTCDWQSLDDGAIRLTWRGVGSGDEIYYLVQWRDRDGTWRGFAPRTTKTELVISPRFRWAAKGDLRVRVLAIERLTTSVQEVELRGEAAEPPVQIVTHRTPGALAAFAFDPLGRQLPASDLAWFGEGGAEVGRGDLLPMAHAGRGVVRVVPIGRGVTYAEGLASIGVQVVEEEPAAPASALPRPPTPPHDHRPQTRKGGTRRADRAE